jgi:hypothetical protein
MASQRRMCIACNELRWRYYSVPQNATNATRWFTSLGIVNPNQNRAKSVRLYVCHLHFHPQDLAENHLRHSLVIPYPGTPEDILNLRPLLPAELGNEIQAENPNLIDPMGIGLFDSADDMEFDLFGNGAEDQANLQNNDAELEANLLSDAEEMENDLLEDAEIIDETAEKVRLEQFEFIGLF